jgi:exopolysaccharide biosynthesis protein
MNGHPFGVTIPVHVLAFSQANFALKIGLAHNAIDGGVQTPRSMCQSTPGCVAAVNGDYFDLTPSGTPDPGDEVGGIIQNCVLLHTPEIAHQQANLDGQSLSGALNWSSTLSFNGASIAITAVNQELPLSYAGVHLPLTGILLFVAPYALATPSAPGWTTYEFAQVNGSASPTTINTTTSLQLVAATTAPLVVPPGDVAIVAPASSSLATLQVGGAVTLNTTSTSGCDNLGGHPILLRGGAAVPIDPADTYLVRRYARTVLGWTSSGETVLMTVSGRDGVSGATAGQLVRLLRSLGVVTAIDLDGGQSASLFSQGRALVSSYHGTERPVSTSLLVVANP